MRISGEKVEHVSKKLGFNGCVRVESVDFSGGIWVLWKESEVTLHVVTLFDQFIHLCRGSSRGDHFHITIV
ncbi:hypothetical protein LINPERHAP2_LOCUS20032 [Linum perenne]